MSECVLQLRRAGSFVQMLVTASAVFNSYSTPNTELLVMLRYDIFVLSFGDHCAAREKDLFAYFVYLIDTQVQNTYRYLGPSYST